MYMLVLVRLLVRTKTYHIYNAHHKRKPSGEVPMLGDIHETSAIRTTLVSLHLSHQSVLHFRLSQKQLLYLRAVNERLRSSAFAWTLSVGCRNLCVICIIGNTHTVRERVRQTYRRDREVDSERSKEWESLSVIVVCIFLLHLTGTEALTPLFSAHNLLHKGID
jgi:hypothetical protein